MIEPLCKAQSAIVLGGLRACPQKNFENQNHPWFQQDLVGGMHITLIRPGKLYCRNGILYLVDIKFGDLTTSTD